MTRVAWGLRRPSRSALARMSGFATSSVAGSIVQLLAIPALVTKAGVDDWANLAIAQSVGSFFAVVVAFGWGVTGPAAVAVRSGAALREYYVRSVLMRSVLLLLMLPPTILLTLASIRGQQVAAVFAALNLVIGSLAGSWYFVGRSDARGLFVLDTLPRMLGTIVGVALVLTFSQLMLFSIAQTAFSALTIVPPLLQMRRLPRDASARLGLREAGRELRSQVSAVVVAATAALYTSAPLVAVGLLAPAAAPVYAVADRIFKFSLNPLIPVTQTLQGWVPHPERSVLTERVRQTARIALALGAAGTLAGAAALLVGAPVLTGGQTLLPWAVILPLAMSFGAITVSRIVGMVCLVSLDRIRALATSTVLGAVSGVLALVVLVPPFGAAGAAAALTVSELGVTGYQLLVLRRALHERIGDATAAAGREA